MGELVGLEIAVLAVSDDAADVGAAVGAQLVEVGHRLHGIERAADEDAAIGERLTAWIADEAVDAVLVFAGANAPTQAATRAVDAVATKPQPSFAQAFRTVAFKAIGNEAITTDAVAALCGSTIVIAVPAPAGALAHAIEVALVAQLDSRTLPRNLATLLPKVKDALAREALSKAPPLRPLPAPVEHGPFATRTPPPPPSRSGGIPKIVGAEKTPLATPPPAPKPASAETTLPRWATTPTQSAADASAIPKPVASTGTAPMRWGDFASGKYDKDAAKLAAVKAPTAKAATTAKDASKPVEAKPVEAKPVEAKPIEAKPVEAKPVEAKPVEEKPVEAKPVEAKPVEAKPVEAKPDEAKPVEAKPVEAKPDESKPTDGKPVDIEAKWVAESQQMPAIVDPPSGAVLIEPPTEAQIEAQVEAAAAAAAVAAAAIAPKTIQPVIEVAKADEIPRPISKEMAVPEEAVLAETVAPPPFKRRRTTTPPPPPPRAQTLDLEPDPEPDAPLPPSAPARAATTDDPPVFAINREDTWRVRRPTVKRNRTLFYVAGAAGVIAIVIIIFIATRSPGNRAVAASDRPSVTPDASEPAKQPPVVTPDAADEIEMTETPIDAAAVAATDAAIDAAVVAQRDPPVTPIKRNDPPRNPPRDPPPRDPPPRDPPPKLPPDAGVAETKLPPPPNVPEGCDEVTCILEKYARPCCAVWKKAEPPVDRPHSGVPATLDKGMIRAGVDRVKPLVIDCGTKAQVKGTVRVSVSVDADGRVTSADASDAPSAELGQCVASALQKAKFGKTENGGTFTYPFIF